VLDLGLIENPILKVWHENGIKFWWEGHFQERVIPFAGRVMDDPSLQTAFLAARSRGRYSTFS
jgi:hypothetical protein